MCNANLSKHAMNFISTAMCELLSYKAQTAKNIIQNAYIFLLTNLKPYKPQNLIIKYRIFYNIR